MVFSKHPYFWGSPYDWPGIVLSELGQVISKYVIKKLDNIIFLNIGQWQIIYKCICNKYYVLLKVWLQMEVLACM